MLAQTLGVMHVHADDHDHDRVDCVECKLGDRAELAAAPNFIQCVNSHLAPTLDAEVEQREYFFVSDYAHIPRGPPTL